MYQTILVPLDGSANSQKALNVAVDIAKKFESKLILLSIIDSRHLYAFNEHVPADLPRNLLDTAKKGIAKSEAQVRESGIEVSSIVETGYPKSLIAKDVPSENNVDLIVMGKSGTGAIDRFVIGSTTEYVVRNASAQVLVVNADQDA